MLVNIVDLSITPSVQHIFSDHFIVSFTPLCNIIPTLTCKPRYAFDFPKADLGSLCSYLLDVDFSVCFQSNDIGFQLSLFSMMPCSCTFLRFV